MGLLWPRHSWLHTETGFCDWEPWIQVWGFSYVVSFVFELMIWIVPNLHGQAGTRRKQVYPMRIFSREKVEWPSLGGYMIAWAVNFGLMWYASSWISTMWLCKEYRRKSAPGQWTDMICIVQHECIPRHFWREFYTGFCMPGLHTLFLWLLWEGYFLNRSWSLPKKGRHCWSSARAILID